MLMSMEDIFLSCYSLFKKAYCLNSTQHTPRFAAEYKWFSISYNTHISVLDEHGYKGSVVNLAFPSLHKRSPKITHQVQHLFLLYCMNDAPGLPPCSCKVLWKVKIYWVSFYPFHSLYSGYSGSTVYSLQSTVYSLSSQPVFCLKPILYRLQSICKESVL